MTKKKCLSSKTKKKNQSERKVERNKLEFSRDKSRKVFFLPSQLQTKRKSCDLACLQNMGPFVS